MMRLRDFGQILGLKSSFTRYHIGNLLTGREMAILDRPESSSLESTWLSCLGAMNHDGTANVNIN